MASLRKPEPDADRVAGAAPPETAWRNLYSDENELRALRHLRQVTNSSEPIFAGVPDFSRISVNNLRLYWLSGRPIGVKEFQLEDRIATEADVQRQIIGDLEQNHVNWVIIDTKDIGRDETFLKHAYVGSNLLDHFISEHFARESRFGDYVILRRTTPYAAVNEADRSAR